MMPSEKWSFLLLSPRCSNSWGDGRLGRPAWTKLYGFLMIALGENCHPERSFLPRMGTETKWKDPYSAQSVVKGKASHQDA